MHAERDHLRDAVFPELEERLRARRHNLEPIDLRLGVETASLADQRARELLVLKVCLNEIERSRPFLLVLIGDRYGWVPPEERIAAAAQEAGYAPDALDKSVTALEIEFGILKKDPEQRRRSLFYFRDPLPYASMSPEDAAVYSDEHSPEPDVRAGHARLQALKDKIASDPELGQRVRHYRLDWDPAEKEPTDASLEAWGRQVLEELWAELDEETREFASRPPADEDEQEREALDEFVQHKLRDFMGRDALVAQLLDLARAPAQEAEAWGACLKGGPGSGKSTVFAALYRELTTATPDSDDAPLVLAHAAGITPRASRVDPMLRRFVKELAAATGQASPLEDTASAEEVDRAFTTLLRQVAEQRRVVVLIDALNQFEPTLRAQHLTWLPARYWPDNARLIATSLPGQESESLEQWAGVEELDVPPLGSDEAQDIARAVWRRYHRECNPDVLAVVLGRTRQDGQPACANPLWLTLAMEQLNLLDADDFNRAGQDLHGLLLEMARNLPPDVEGLYAALLARCEKLFGASWARAFACLTALGRSGWRESDYKALLPKAAAVLSPGEPPIAWDPLRFAALRRGFRAQIILRGEHGRWDFSHAQMRQAILRQYLADAAVRRALHEAMASHLLALEAGDPLRDAETMHHLIEADDKTRAAAFFAQENPSSESVQALAQHIAIYAEQETNPGIAWTVSLLRQPDLDPDSLSWLANNILFDLHTSIEYVTPLPLRLQLLTGVSQELTTHVKRDPANLRWQRHLSANHNMIGDVLRDWGDLNGTLTAYQASYAILARLAESDPRNVGWQRDLSLVHNRIGNVLKDQGDLDGALAAYQASYAIDARLAEADPQNAVWQGDTAVSHRKLGDVLKDQGDLDGALTAYQASYAILARLAEAAPQNAGWQENLSVSHIKIGDVLKDQGDLGGALTAYQASYAILARLAEADPRNANWRRNLSVSHIKIGDVLKAQGDLDGALTAYQADLKISARLAEADPSHAGWQRDLSVSHEKNGDVLRDQGDLGGALTAYQAGLAIRARLAEADPQNADWQLDLSVSHDRIGDVLKVRGDLDGAMTAYQAGLAIRARLAEADPRNADWQQGVWISYYKMATVLEAVGAANAVEYWQKAYDKLFSMKQAGLFISPQDLPALQFFQSKIKR